MRLSHGLIALLLSCISSCSFTPNLNVVDEGFIADNQGIFQGYDRGATFSRADDEEQVNLYIRRTGSSLWLKPVLYFSTGETSLLDSDYFIQIALPRSRLVPENPYKIVSHAGGYLHQTLIWLKDGVSADNVVIDHRVDESSLFFLGGLGIEGTGDIDVASLVVLPQPQDGDDDVIIVNKRLADCAPKDCNARIEKILSN